MSLGGIGAILSNGSSDSYQNLPPDEVDEILSFSSKDLISRKNSMSSSTIIKNEHHSKIKNDDFLSDSNSGSEYERLALNHKGSGLINSKSGTKSSFIENENDILSFEQSTAKLGESGIDLNIRSASSLIKTFNNLISDNQEDQSSVIQRSKPTIFEQAKQDGKISEKSKRTISFESSPNSSNSSKNVSYDQIISLLSENDSFNEKQKRLDKSKKSSHKKKKHLSDDQKKSLESLSNQLSQPSIIFDDQPVQEKNSANMEENNKEGTVLSGSDVFSY